MFGNVLAKTVYLIPCSAGEGIVKTRMALLSVDRLMIMNDDLGVLPKNRHLIFYEWETDQFELGLLSKSPTQFGISSSGSVPGSRQTSSSGM